MIRMQLAPFPLNIPCMPSDFAILTSPYKSSRHQHMHAWQGGGEVGSEDRQHHYYPPARVLCTFSRFPGPASGS